MAQQFLKQAEGQPDQLLLYVDQWEELYVQASGPDQTKRHRDDVERFVELLLNASQSPFMRVVATVRADFYDPLIRDLGSFRPARQVTPTGMSRDELKRIISQ
jgi:hypothetical protein